MSNPKRIRILLSVCTLLMAGSAWAKVPVACQDGIGATFRKGGAGGGNGDNNQEIAFENRLHKLAVFLRTEDGQNLFPEVDADEFAIVARNADVHIRPGALFDRAGNPRTCVWNDANCTITCDEDKHVTEETNAEVAFVESMHEELGLLGIPDGEGNNPSEYDKSKRLFGWVKQVIGNDLVAPSSLPDSAELPNGLVPNGRVSGQVRINRSYTLNPGQDKIILNKFCSVTLAAPTTVIETIRLQSYAITSIISHGTNEFGSGRIKYFMTLNHPRFTSLNCLGRYYSSERIFNYEVHGTYRRLQRYAHPAAQITLRSF